MAMRPGSYNASPEDWRGVICEGSWGTFRCTHADHGYQPDATRCAREAYAARKEEFRAGRCPPGRERIGRGSEPGGSGG